MWRPTITPIQSKSSLSIWTPQTSSSALTAAARCHLFTPIPSLERILPRMQKRIRCRHGRPTPHSQFDSMLEQIKTLCGGLEQRSRATTTHDPHPNPTKRLTSRERPKQHAGKDRWYNRSSNSSCWCSNLFAIASDTYGQSESVQG